MLSTHIFINNMQEHLKKQQFMYAPYIPHYPYQSPIFQKDILLQIIQREQYIEKNMNNKIVLELSEAFIGKVKLMSFPKHISLIKKKIHKILEQERQKWQQCFTLPRINSLNLEAKTCLYTLMELIWDKFNETLNRSVKDNQNISKYLCHSTNSQQIQQFHCDMMNYIKDGFFHQTFQNMNVSPFSGYPKLYENQIQLKQQALQQINQEQLDIYEKSFNFKQQLPQIKVNQFEKIDHHNNSSYSQQRNLQYLTPKQKPLLIKDFVKHNNHMKKAEKSDDSEYEPQNLKIKQINSKQQNDAYIKDRMSIYEEINKNQKLIQQNELIRNPYKKCVCYGQVKKSKLRYFKCIKCLYLFHYQCLGMHPSPNFKTQKCCPSCYFQNDNILYQSINPPLAIFWTNSRQLHKQKIFIKGKRSLKIIQHKNSIQIKIVRIDGSSQLKNNISQNFHKNLINEIILNSQYLTRSSRDHIRINFDVMTTQKNKNQADNNSSFRLFGCIFQARKRTLNEVLSIHIPQTDSNYLNKFIQKHQQIKIQILNNELKLIKIPVRGTYCNHPQVFDLEQFVKNYIELSIQTCYYCEKVCHSFVIDSQIREIIKQIEQDVNGQSQYPSFVYYSGRGFRWKQQQINDENRDSISEQINLGSEEEDY